MKDTRLVAILRLGKDDPCTGDVRAMKKLTGGDLSKATGASLPFGIISMLYTDLSAEYITNVYIEAEGDDDMYPVIVWDVDSTTSGVYLSMLQDIYDELVEASRTLAKDTNGSSIILSIDDVLDKINREGIDSLSERELALLKGGSN